MKIPLTEAQKLIIKNGKLKQNAWLLSMKSLMVHSLNRMKYSANTIRWTTKTDEEPTGSTNGYDW